MRKISWNDLFNLFESFLTYELDDGIILVIFGSTVVLVSIIITWDIGACKLSMRYRHRRELNIRMASFSKHVLILFSICRFWYGKAMTIIHISLERLFSKRKNWQKMPIFHHINFILFYTWKKGMSLMTLISQIKGVKRYILVLLSGLFFWTSWDRIRWPHYYTWSGLAHHILANYIYLLIFKIFNFTIPRIMALTTDVIRIF